VNDVTSAIEKVLMHRARPRDRKSDDHAPPVARAGRCHRTDGAVDQSPMAGYSGTPLLQKLGIKPASRLGLLNAPGGFDQLLGDLPAGVRTTRRLAGSLDVALYFSRARADLAARFAALARAIAPAGALWVAWPKKSSGVQSDLDENVVRAIGLEQGLVDVKVCAIDDVWSGLKFVVRLVNRPK
jgi:hypothetical protein